MLLFFFQIDQRAGPRPLRQSDPVRVPQHGRVFRHKGPQERRHNRPRRGRIVAEREAHLRSGQQHTPPVPRQPVRLLPNGRARLLRDGVRGRRRSDDAHPRGRVHRTAGRVLRGLRRPRSTVPAREQDHLPRPEARQSSAGHRGLREDCRFRSV